MSDLTKWPRLLVQGEPVTEQQANEILIRTCQPAYLSGNDPTWTETVNRVMGFPGGEDWPPKDIAKNDADRMAWHQARWAARDERVAELGIVPLEYLYTSRIASAWIGGPHGWCDWDGRIGCDSYNIGKWPEEQEITDEWTQIAEAFPYLNLTAQLVTDEGDGALAAEWHVHGGTAERREPGKQIRLMGEPSMLGFLMPGRERGVSAERLKVAVAQVIEARTSGAK